MERKEKIRKYSVPWKNNLFKRSKPKKKKKKRKKKEIKEANLSLAFLNQIPKYPS